MRSLAQPGSFVQELVQNRSMLLYMPASSTGDLVHLQILGHDVTFAIHVASAATIHHLGAILVLMSAPQHGLRPVIVVIFC